jgi:hypothetical protein
VLLWWRWACGRRAASSKLLCSSSHVHGHYGCEADCGWVGGTPAPEGAALQLDPLRVVKETIEDCIGIGGMADHLMPFVDAMMVECRP